MVAKSSHEARKFMSHKTRMCKQEQQNACGFVVRSNGSGVILRTIGVAVAWCARAPAASQAGILHVP